MPGTEHRVRLLGAETRYWEYGPADAATTLVLVHGFRGEHHGLEPVVGHLRGLRILSPDLPAFGLSAALPGRTHDVATYAEWLDAFVTAMGVRGDAVILGHSFGSIVASAAVAGGLPTPKLILVNPIAQPALRGPNGVMSRLTLAYYRAAGALPQRIGAALLSNWPIVRLMSLVMVQSRDAATRAFVHAQHHAHFSSYATRDSLIEGFEASIGSDVSQFAPDIATPTLLVGAERDPLTSVAAQQRLQTLFPDARLVLIPDVGHLIHYETPRPAAEAIVEFVADGAVAR